MTRRPKPFRIGPVRVRAIRGPDARGWYFRAQVYEDGGERTVWTGWATDPLHVHGEILALLQGRTPRPEPTTEVATVRDLLRVWVGAQQARRDLAAGTKRHYKIQGKAMVRMIGDVRLDRIGPQFGEAWRDRALASGVAPGTLRGQFGTLRVAWRWGFARGLVPAEHLPLPRVKRTPTRKDYTPTLEEAWKVADELDGWKRAAMVMLLSTGARIGEIAGLTWEACDRDAGEVTLTGKTGPRTVLVPAAFWDALDTLPSASPERPAGRVFGHLQFRTVTDNFSVRALAKACAEAGVPRFTAHGVRRLVVGQYYSSGVDVGTAAALLGHSPEVALRHYRKVTRDDQVRALALSGVGSRGGQKVVSIDAARDKTRTG